MFVVVAQEFHLLGHLYFHCALVGKLEEPTVKLSMIQNVLVDLLNEDGRQRRKHLGDILML